MLRKHVGHLDLFRKIARKYASIEDAMRVYKVWAALLFDNRLTFLPGFPAEVPIIYCFASWNDAPAFKVIGWKSCIVRISLLSPFGLQARTKLQFDVRIKQGYFDSLAN